METKIEDLIATPLTSIGEASVDMNNNDDPVNTSRLMELFEEQLKKIFWSEKELIKAIPMMISYSTTENLILALLDHLHQTRSHVTRLAKVFEIIGKKPAAIKSARLEKLVVEASEIVDDCKKGPECDARVIAAAQKIEHYEIATYGTLRKFAETLGLKDAEKLLLKTLDDEKEVESKLTVIATLSVNSEAENSNHTNGLSNHRVSQK